MRLAIVAESIPGAEARSAKELGPFRDSSLYFVQSPRGWGRWNRRLHLLRADEKRLLLWFGQKLLKLRIPEDMRAYHVPEIPASRDSFECIKLARIILVIILSKRNLAPIHLRLFFIKLCDNLTLLDIGHMDFEHVHVVHVVHALRIFEGKTEIGIGSLFQIYDPTSLLF